MTFTLANSFSVFLCDLYFLNAFIGLAEAFLLIRFFRLKRRNTIALIIAANYVSAWVYMIGAQYLTRAIEPLWGDTPFAYAGPTVLTLIALSLVATLALEAPFVFAVFRMHRPDSGRAWLRGLLLVHLVTYPPLLAIYAFQSESSLYTKYDHVDAPTLVRDLHPGPLPWVYFIDESHRRVVRVRLDGSSRETVTERDAPMPGHRLIAWPDEHGDGTINIWWQGKMIYADRESLGEKYFSGTPNVTVTDASRVTVYPEEDPTSENGWFHVGTYATINSVSNLATDEPGFDVRVNPPTRGGLSIGLDVSGRIADIGFLNFVYGWDFSAGHVSVLDHSLIVFEMGPYPLGREGSTIAIASPEHGLIAELAMGTWPVVVYENEAGSTVGSE